MSPVLKIETATMVLPPRMAGSAPGISLTTFFLVVDHSLEEEFSNHYLGKVQFVPAESCQIITDARQIDGVESFTPYEKE